MGTTKIGRIRGDRLLLLTGIACFAASAATSSDGPSRWWAPGEGRSFPAYLSYANDSGELGLLNDGGAFETKGHPFFEPLGRNGRACVSCHQPADGMALSLKSIHERWEATDGRDPIFAVIDGANCPNLPQGDPASHSLLLKRGLFRIFLPWPPKARDGTPIKPEFDIEVVRDPGGCNLDPSYGLNSANPTISVYRRPRVVANMQYVLHRNFGIGAFVGKTGEPALRDPENGQPVNMNMMADAREPTVKTQAVEAAITHLQFDGKLSPEQLQRIKDFEYQIYSAQVKLDGAGSLVESDGPPGMGPYNLARGEKGVLGNNITKWVIPVGDAWQVKKPGESDDEFAKRQSILRGQKIFHFRTFWIKDSMYLNNVGLGNPVKRTCATCHGMHMTGMDTANGWMDLGTTNLPWAKEAPRNPWQTEDELMPLFKITCHKDVQPHPYLGRVIYTQDPGRALISGKCNDVGAIVMQQFRGLAAHAPYFSNGSAANIRELIDFYDRRYNIQYSEQEKTDLGNFLTSL
ncbi:hypothetical protein [Croceibacterium salegens]|uniref:hypothetical protein n=1 Tax=Croceibacterium salegens TaxID=1737568 RepID=UPI000AB4DFA3|nr:hypothetical protein [Croceibacterium salegens]